jgi:hypothetical protein
MISSAPVDPAMSMAVSNDHSDAVEKSVGIRMRRQGYMFVVLRRPFVVREITTDDER